ncbi:MAG: nucleotidyltransferase domain-containing protein [Deltaproteobacteria bacterium]|nr:nucleotidyltransferase domain-containing protein [Deltaproteobacteria bacterium]
MSKMEIDKIKELLAKDERVVFAYLFGSRAKGMASEKSDFDIAVYAADAHLWLNFYIEADIAQLLKTDDVQVFILNRLYEPLFGFEIIKNGILLVDKEQEKRIEFESRILGQYHDWQYFAKRHMEAEGWQYQ